MKKPATIYDIAKKVDTSPATVSRVLSNSNYPVRPALADKIRKAAKELNYSPNAIGRQLKTNRTSTIGVIIPSITNPFYAAIVSGIEETASAQGFQVLLCNSQNNPDLEQQHLSTLYENQVKGVIISSIVKKNVALKQYMDNGLKVITIDQNYPNTGSRQIKFDYRKGGRIITQYLIDRGHREIAYLSLPLDRPSRRLIFQGYEQACLLNGLKPDMDRVMISNDKTGATGKSFDEFEAGKMLTNQLLQSKPYPTAILACNDMMAFGVMNELIERGIRIPEDISVAGFDNLSFAGIVAPSLTTIDQPKQETGIIACNMLIELMNNRNDQPEAILLEPQLIERKSVRSLI